MDSTLHRSRKYNCVPCVRRCNSTILAIGFIPWYVCVNATKVRVQYRPQQQRQRDVKLSSDPKIIGGTPAAPGAYPFHVSALETSSSFCGGTLIAPDIVLTAAHCGGSFLDGVNIGGILLDGTDAVETLAVDFELPHPDYFDDDFDTINDIMLVKLTDPSTLSPVVELNFDPSIPAVGDVVTVIGFGITVDGGSDLSNELLTVNVDVYADDVCFNYYNLIDPPEQTICAGTVAGGRDSCQGDSGGPLLTADNVQIGIVSYGGACGLPDVPAVYNEISAYESFIRDGICALSDTPPVDCATTIYPSGTASPTSTTSFPTIDSAQPTDAPVIGIPSTTAPAAVGQPATAPTSAPVDDTTAQPSMDETTPPKYEGKGKGKGKGNEGYYGKGKGKGKGNEGYYGKGKGKGKGNEGYYGKGKGNMQMHWGKGGGKGDVFRYKKYFTVYSDEILRQVDHQLGTEDSSVAGNDDNTNLFPLSQGPPNP